MYKVDDIVAYSSQGVCRITEICTREIGGKRMDYYILKPVFDSRSTVSVPVDNERLVGRMRRVLSREQANSLVDSISDAENIWMDDDNKRREYFNSLMIEGSPEKFAAIFKTLVLRRQQLEALSRKLRTADETFLRQSEKLLCCECSYAGAGEQAEIKQKLMSGLL